MRKFELYTGEDEFMSYQQRINYSESVMTDMITYDVPEMTYSQSRVPIGRYKRSGDVFYLNMSQSNCVLILGARGSGKTVLANCMLDRAMKSRVDVTVFDVKGEYTQKYKPLHSDYVKVVRDKLGDDTPQYLFSTEKPQGFPTKTFYPVFLQNLRRSQTGKIRVLQPNESLCQLGMEQLTRADFLTFFEPITNENPAYHTTFEILWNSIQENSLFSWEEIVDHIENNDAYDSRQKKMVIRSIMILKDNDIIGDQYEYPDLVGCIKEGKLGILNLQGLLDLPTSVSPALVYVNILLRKIYNSKVQGVVSKKVHNLIHIDEINKVIPKMGSSPSKVEYLKLVDLCRSEHISLSYSTQDWKRIPDTLIEQANYIFLPYNVDIENLSEIVKTYLPHLYSVPQTFKSEMGRLSGQLQKYRDGRRDWMIIDKEHKRLEIIIPVLPLSFFPRESDEV